MGDNDKRKIGEPGIYLVQGHKGTPYPGLRSLEAERENLKMTHKADQKRVTRLGLEDQPVLATGMLILGRSEHGYDEGLID